MNRVHIAIADFHRLFNGLLDYMCEHGRGAEWVTVFVKFYTAYILILPGETLNLRTYATMKSVGGADWLVAVILIALALNHAAALLRNGSWKRSPVWRGVCCFLGALIFGSMWFLTQASPMQTPVLSPAFLAGYVLLEIIGCRRAGDDHKCLTPLS